MQHDRSIGLRPSFTTYLPCRAELDRAISFALDAEGLGDHGYLEDYRKLATTMLRFFATARAGGLPPLKWSSQKYGILP